MPGESHCTHDQRLRCLVRGVLDVVSKKWVICITNLLEAGGVMRYNEIKNQLGEISPKTLSDALKVLEKEALIERKVTPKPLPALSIN